MSHRLAAAPLALIVLSGAALAQDDPQTVGVSVDGAVVEVPVDLAAEACGLDAETLLAEWGALDTELTTMADTSVGVDATDLAPEVAVDTPMDSVLDGESVADGADATHEVDGDSAPDMASDVNAAEGATGADTAEAEGSAEVAAGDAGDAVSTASTEDTQPGSEPEVPADGSMDAGVEVTADAGGATGDDPATADAATSEEVAAGALEQEATGGPATPTEGTTLSKAAVCEVSREKAEPLGIAVPG